MTMILPSIDPMTNNYGFISTSTSADFANDNDIITYWSIDGFTFNFKRTITTKLDRLLDQHTLILPGK